MNKFEAFTERSLEASTFELFGIQTVVDRCVGTPWRCEVDSWEDVGVVNARLGYALRHRETQLVDCATISDDDPLAELAAQRMDGHGIPEAVVHRIVQEVITDHGRDLYQCTTGTTPQLRKSALHKWVDDHFGGDTRQLAALEHGYFLHRLFEIEPSYCGE
jgi:hypothetical protein